MQRINDNPFAPHKMRAANATGRSSASGFGTSGVVDRNDPSSGYSYPGVRMNTGSKPTPGNPYNTGSPPKPPTTSNVPAQNIPGGSGGGYSSVMHGTAVDAASRGAFGPRQPIQSQTSQAPTSEYQPFSFAPRIPIDDPYGPGNGQLPGAPPAEPTPLPRDEWRDKWMGSGTSNIEGLKNFLRQYGGTLLSDNGLTRTPWGEVFDLLIGARTGQGTPGWTIPGGSSPIDSNAGGVLEIPGLKELIATLAGQNQNYGDVKTARVPKPYENAYGPQQWNPMTQTIAQPTLSGYY